MSSSRKPSRKPKKFTASGPGPALEVRTTPPKKQAPADAQADELVRMLGVVAERDPAAYQHIKALMRSFADVHSLARADESSAPIDSDAMRLLTEACTAAGGILPRDLVPWIEARRVQEPALEEWQALGAKLAERPHRLALATHAARAATSGGNLDAAQEDALADQLVAIVDEGIARTGGVQPAASREAGQTNPCAVAVWYVIRADWHRDPGENLRPPRCPSMATMHVSPNEPGFVDDLRAAIPGYLRTVVAGADDGEIEDLATLFTLDERALDERYRPWAGPFTEDVYPNEMHERALATMTRRYYSPKDMCAAVEDYAFALDLARVEADMPPLTRIGLVVWLARVGCRAGGAE